MNAARNIPYPLGRLTWRASVSHIVLWQSYKTKPWDLMRSRKLLDDTVFRRCTKGGVCHRDSATMFVGADGPLDTPLSAAWRNKMNRAVWIGMVSTFVVALLASCRHSDVAATAAPAPTSRVAPTSPTSTPPHHWVQSDQLQVVMKKLESASARHWPGSLPDDPEVALTRKERNQVFESGAQLALGLADAAARIPATTRALNLSDADRSAFLTTANGLSEQARMLGMAARKHSVEEMQRHLDAIRASCISCHTRFKDIAGDLPPRA